MPNQAIRALQHALLGLDYDPGPADGIDGPRTRAAAALFGKRGAPAPALGGIGLTRIIWHWTAGTYAVSATDRMRYHFIIDGDGTVAAGDRKPEDNISATDGTYAAHTRGANTGSIGVSVAAMHRAMERPFDAGAYPIKPVQIDALVRLSADLSRRYGIKPTPATMLSHAEVPITLGIKQAGKWDISWLPGMAAPQDPFGIGNILRARVAAFLIKGA